MSILVVYYGLPHFFSWSYYLVPHVKSSQVMSGQAFYFLLINIFPVLYRSLVSMNCHTPAPTFSRAVTLRFAYDE
jgi:hypothetical protein